jgi:predicted nucleotidyltransferase
MKMIAEFAQEICDKLEEYLRPAEVSFRGSFASGTFDEYSDIDLQADVRCELSGQFHAAL